MRAILALILPLMLAWAGAAQGQLYRFGKNKIQYDEFSWQKMETRHFDIYFYEAEAELARYAASMAEEGYYNLEKKLGHSVRRRIPLILYSSHIYFEQTNIIPGLLPEGVAGFTEFLKGRVALPLSGSYPEFERVLHHELVHVFMFDRIRQVLRARGISGFRPGPLWFSEGLAEYWSGEWDRYGDMILRDALFADRLVPISHMHRINGTFQMYKEGQSICQHMAEQYGEDIFQRLLTNWWRGETLGEIFEATTGDELEDLDEKWGYQLRKRYLPGIAAADPPSQVTRAITRIGHNLKPAAVPTPAAAEADSGTFVYFMNHRGYTQIARMSVAGGKPEVVVEGERLPAFESLHPLATSLAVSADGRWLAFSAKHLGRDHLHVWDLEQGGERHRFSFASLVSISSPSWSPDGDQLVISGADGGGASDLYLVAMPTGDLTPLTRDLYHDRDPDWDVGGRRIVFSSDRWEGGRSGLYNLFVYDISSRQISCLTRGHHSDLQPAWSPDGEWVTFSSDRDQMYDLYAMRIPEASGGPTVGAAPARLTRMLTGAFDPEWLPDGSGLLYTGFERGGFQVYHLPVALDSLVALADSLASPSDAYVDGGWQLTGLANGPPATQHQYRRRLSLDVAQSQISQDPVFGTSGGIQLGLSDVLGNDQYYFVLSHIAGSDAGFFDGLNVAFGRVHLARRLHVGWGLFRLNDRFTSTFGRYVREKRTGGYAELSFPFTRNNRLVFRMSGRHSDLDRELEGRRLRGWLISNYLSYTHDSSLWIPTGPLEGTRYSLGIGQNVDFKSSSRYSTTLFADYRRYLRLTRRSCLAARYMARHSRGPVPEAFSLGGSWTLRGYPWRSIWGRNLVLVNHELRFPLVDRFLVALPFGNIDFTAFRGALFVDAGNAWGDDFGEWRGSLGGGVRLALGGVFVLRLDRSRRTDFRSLGDETHWDFFFGWDF